MFLILLAVAGVKIGQSYLTQWVNEEVEGVSWDAVSISPFKGVIEVKGLEVKDPEVQVLSDEVVLTVEPAELFDLITGERELSVAEVSAKQLQVFTEGNVFTSGTLHMTVSGRFVLEQPQESVITHLALDLQLSRAESEEGALAFESPVLSFEAFGMYQEFEQIESLGDVIAMSEEVYLTCEAPSLTLSQELREYLAAAVPLSSWLTDTEAFKGEHVKVNLAFPDDRVEMKGLDLSFPILKAEGEGMFFPSDPMRMRVDLNVYHLEESIRDEVNTLLFFFFQAIPEGAFRFYLDTSDPRTPPRVFPSILF